MKRKFNLQLFSSLTSIIFFIFLLGCKDNSKDDASRSVDKQEYTEVEIEKIAEKIYSDAQFKLIEPILIRRIKDNLELSDTTAQLRLKNVTSLPVGKNLKDNDSKVLATSLGFDNLKEITEYFNNYHKLLTKYSVSSLSEENALSLEAAIRNKCLSNEFVKSNDILSLVNRKIPSTASARDMRPECYKCVFDYLNCTQGFNSYAYTTNVTMGYDEYGPSLSSYLVHYTSGQYTITVVLTFVTSTGEITINSTRTTYADSCTAWYNSCLQSQCFQM